LGRKVYEYRDLNGSGELDAHGRCARCLDGGVIHPA
jgi:hypothetical protein